MKTSKNSSHKYKDTLTKSISLNGIIYSYRDFGTENDSGVPIIFLNHWWAVLDNFDPYIVDAIAHTQRVIAVNYRGIWSSSGSAPLIVGEMADDVIAFIRVLGFTKVDLFGFSLWGMVAQDMVLKVPELIRKLILAGTWPAGGKGINQVGSVSWPLIIKGLITFQDPKLYLFFTSSKKSQLAWKAFLARLKERKLNRDKEPTPRAFLRQLEAIHAWGNQLPQDLGKINIPVLIANWDNDIMVPTENTYDLAKRIKNSEILIYQDAGHGGIFQYPEDFTSKVLNFLNK